MVAVSGCRHAVKTRTVVGYEPTLLKESASPVLHPQQLRDKDRRNHLRVDQRIHGPYRSGGGGQIARHEKGNPVWAALAFAGGTLMSIPLVLPPIFWGVAAFTPTRAPEITAIMHELAMLTFVTTDQYYIFMWVAIAVIALIPNTVVHTPFPRWFGYYTAWTTLMFEAGAIAFLTRSGPFARNGWLALWSPVVTFFAWIIVIAVLLFRAIALQDEVSATAVAAHG
jgi:hypothetical protein